MLKMSVTTMQTIRVPALILLLGLAALLAACAPATAPSAPPAAAPPVAAAPTPGQLPVRFQQPAYFLRESDADGALGGGREEMKVPVGADISSTTGPVALRDILKKLAALKKMTVAWASDVDQHALVDVDVRAEDDFFEAIDNILHQLDYYHEVKGNAINVKYRETKRFQIAMPFMTSTYNTGVGGDVLGAGGGAGVGSSTLVGNIQITSKDNKFDIWDNIRKNLDQLLGIWEETVPAAAPAGDAQGATPAATTTRRNVQAGKGYYTIDKPIGLITVTAPRPLLQQIEQYLNNLKTQLFRQISIEAKIVEVELTGGSTTGIDWAGVLSGKQVDFQVFGSNGIIYPNRRRDSPDNIITAGRAITQVAIGPNPFTLLLDAIASQGKTNVLANPKISVLNGQPAMISVGETFRYISEVAVTVNEGGTSTSVSTDTVMSGLGLAVLPTITDNNEVVLSLTPVTSQVSDIDERSFSGLTVQLPTISIREMHTIVQVKSGDTLMIGGLIDSQDTTDTSKVPLLGDLPGLGRLFRHDTTTQRKKELVILLQPTII